jgi:hypothetical protein
MVHKNHELPVPHVGLDAGVSIPEFYLAHKDWSFETMENADLSHFTHVITPSQYLPGFKTLASASFHKFDIKKMKSIKYPKYHVLQRNDLLVIGNKIKSSCKKT